MRRFPLLISAIAIILVAALTGAALLAYHSEKRITAYFSAATGLYAGDPVRVLGVQVGTVESITPQPGDVRVVLSYDPGIDIPADARAAIVAPTLVSGRHVQLAPVYTGGPALPDDATIPRSRTVTPVEWDRLVRELTLLSQQLSAHDGELTGALGRALDSADANLSGQGNRVNESIRNASAAMTTLAAGGEDLFGTVGNLATVTAALAQNNTDVAAFSEQLAQVSAALDSDQDALAAVFASLDEASGQIQHFVQDNQGLLQEDAAALSATAEKLAGNRQALADLLQRAPTGASNLNNIYDPVSGTIDGVFALNHTSDPASFTCSLIFAAGGHTDDTNRTCETAIGPFVEVLRMNNVPLLASPIQSAPAPAQPPPPEPAPPPALPGLPVPGGG